MLRQLTRCLLALSLLGASPGAGLLAAERESLDWSAWRHIPVFHDGRIMPLDTFARDAVEIITDRTSPKLGLVGAVDNDELESSDYDQARALFPAQGKLKVGEPRTFDASVLLFSWLTEPQKWEDVPFLLAEHDELREEFLDLPVTNKKGEHLRYASPRQVQEATAFHQALRDLSARRQQAMAKGEEFQLHGVDKKLSELSNAYTLYRSLTFDPDLLVSFPRMEELQIDSRFLKAFQSTVETWQGMGDGLQAFGSLPDAASSVARGQAALEQLYQYSRQAGVTRAQVEPSVIELIEAADELATFFGSSRGKLLENPPPGWDARQLDNAQTLFRQYDWQARQLVKQTKEMHRALYDNGNALRLLPALDPYALEKDRQREDESQPWISLQMLLAGSEAVLAGYPSSEVQQARAAWNELSESYRESRRTPSNRHAERFSKAASDLSSALRSLGEVVEPLRQQLPIRSRDDDLIAYTAYPEPGSTAVEVRYNRVQPFKWSWIISLAAATSIALAFGVVRKPMFWTGMVLLAVGLAWTAYGFSMRVAITGWAPVTNMYETVVYVPFFVSLLGAWFTLLPLTWPGLKLSWRLGAVPGTWESTELGEDELRLMQPSGWSMAGFLLLLPRAALMALVFWVLARAPYAAAGRTIINLLPATELGQSAPDANDLVTWFVGLLVLVPAVWFLPRVILTLLGGLALVPLAIRSRAGALLAHVYPRWPFALAATLVAFFGSFVAWWSPVLDESIGPLQPVLRDNFWLTIHVLTIVSSYGAGALTWGLGNISLAYYLFGRYRDPVLHAWPAGHVPADDDTLELEPQGRRPPEACATLAGYIYKAMQVAVLLLISGTILGGLWADVSWGRFWGWDPKEVWALISGLVYLAILHGRYAGWFGNFGLAMGSVLGASAIIFSWYGVNFLLGAGLHSYGFGDGGQIEVGIAVASNWLFALAATVRYMAETKIPTDVRQLDEPVQAETL